MARLSIQQGVGKMFNRRAIEAFGKENRNMSLDSPWHGVDPLQGRLQSHLDFQWVRRWYLAEKGLLGSSGAVLDVGSGNGRMIRYLAGICDRIVGLEPYEPFYAKLAILTGQYPHLRVHQATLSEYAASPHAGQEFDLIYVSGVTPYFDDEELKAFFQDVRKLLSPEGRVIVRELGSVATTKYAPTQVNRTSDQVITVARDCGLACERWARAYPPFLFNWLHGRHPNLITRYLRDLTLKPLFFPFWNLFARLNLPTRFKLPRGQSEDYHVYLFRHL